jgi:multidrug efflux system membrane fusion protein
MSLELNSEQSPNGRIDQHESKGGHWLRPVLYVAFAAILGFVGWRIYQNQLAKQKADQMAATALLNRPTPVSVAPVEQKSLPIYLTALGTVTPYYTVTVKARVNGQLDSVKFIEGQQVTEGQTIMVIDPKPYKAALDQAKGTLAHDQALLKNAQAEYARYKALYDAGVVSKETLDTDEAAQGQYVGAIESDKAAIETAQLSLDWCYIKAPIKGRIGLRLVDPGNIVTANTTSLVVINQIQPIAVYFTLPENQLPQVLHKLATDHKLAAEVFDRGDVQHLTTGQLLTADNQIDTTTGTDKLKAVFDNKDLQLFPNQFVNIHLVMEQRPNALVVPSAAIQTGSQGTFVWVTAPDPKDASKFIVRRKSVKIALAEGQQTILDSGVEPTDKVVVDGTDRLKDESSVTINVPKQRGAGAGSASSPGASNTPAPGSGNPFGAAPVQGDAPSTAAPQKSQHSAGAEGGRRKQ